MLNQIILGAITLVIAPLKLDCSLEGKETKIKKTKQSCSIVIGNLYWLC